MEKLVERDLFSIALEVITLQCTGNQEVCMRGAKLSLQLRLTTSCVLRLISLSGHRDFIDVLDPIQKKKINPPGVSYSNRDYILANIFFLQKELNCHTPNKAEEGKPKMRGMDEEGVALSWHLRDEWPRFLFLFVGGR